MKSLFLLLIGIFLYADSIKSFNTIIVGSSINRYGINKKAKLANINIIKKDKMKFISDIEYFHSDSFRSNINLDKKFNKIDMITIRQLSLEFVIKQDLAITFGMLPFNFGTLSDKCSLITTKGNGLATSTSINITGLFLTKTYNKNEFIMGYGIKNPIFNTEINLNNTNKSIISDGDQEKNFNNTNGLFIINKIRNKHWFLENDLYHIKLFINNSHMTDISLINFGFKYNSFLESNDVYFGTLGISLPNNINNSNMVKNKIGKSLMIGWSRFSNLEFFNRESISTIAFKWNFNNFINFSFGEPFTLSGYSDVGPCTILSEKIYLSNRLTFLLRYKHIFGNTVIKPGTLNYYETDDRKIKDTLSIGFKYKF